jgi:hypothetical protein
MYVLKPERKIYKSVHNIPNTALNSTASKAQERVDHMRPRNEFLSSYLPMAFSTLTNRTFGYKH